MKRSGNAGVAVGILDKSGNRRHWSTVDFWSDGLRRPRTETEAPADPEVEDAAGALRAAGIGIDVPLRLSTEMISSSDFLRQFGFPPAAESSYHLLRLACTFRQGRGEKFTRADLTVTLRPAEPGRLQPVASWMSPVLELDSTDRGTTVTIGSDLKVIKGEVKRENKSSAKTATVRAYNLYRSNPYWRFTATNSTALEGSFVVDLLARTEPNSLTEGVATLDVVVERPRRLRRDQMLEIKGAARVGVKFGPEGGEGPMWVEEPPRPELLDDPADRFSCPPILRPYMPPDD